MSQAGILGPLAFVIIVGFLVTKVVLKFFVPKPGKPLSRKKILRAYVISCLVFVACIHLIVAYVGYDPFTHTFFTGPYANIDLWSFVHVGTFFTVGVMFPDRAGHMMLYGALWEGWEFAMTHIESKATGATPLQSFWNERGVDSCWDIWFNLMGYRIGEWYCNSFILMKGCQPDGDGDGTKDSPRPPVARPSGKGAKGRKPKKLAREVD